VPLPRQASGTATHKHQSTTKGQPSAERRVQQRAPSDEGVLMTRTNPYLPLCGAVTVLVVSWGCPRPARAAGVVSTCEHPVELRMVDVWKFR
jgi:hypothetical protein